MFGWGKKSVSKTLSNSYKSRIHEFWEWFSENASRFHAVISRNESTDLVGDVESKLDVLLPGFAWAFGPGDGENKHAFTLTGEGNMPKQLLAQFWYQIAPDLEGWTFYPAKQPTPPESLAGAAIQLQNGAQVDAENLTIASIFDSEENVFHITCAHPAFPNLPESERDFLLMLLLDEALGEFGVAQFIGTIEFGPPPPNSKSMKLVEFPTYLEHARRYHGWEPRSILNSYSLYELPTQNTKRPRADSIGGTTLISNVVAEYIERGKPLKDDSLKKLGAEIAYLKFPTSNLDADNLVDSRSRIEDAIQEALESNFSGRTVGGAIGTQNSYIDLLLIDGENSRELVLQTVKQFALHGTVSIETML